MLTALLNLLSNIKEYTYLFKYGSCLLVKILEESKKFNAFELSLFSKATIPEKYFEKFFESKLSKLELLECIGV